ncbi:MAG: DUF86 domain-containing protein [Bacteroidales bacterium]|nr:DUF86 domain-containing protein [Bacteroidales bacterium]MDE7357638.1 DUF86 domain-containing protein [Bacteroidales bacterium]
MFQRRTRRNKTLDIWIEPCASTFSNFIIHAYDSLNPEILWGIIINHLPLLKTEVKSLLAR